MTHILPPLKKISRGVLERSFAGQATLKPDGNGRAARRLDLHAELTASLTARTRKMLDFCRTFATLG